MITLTQLSGLPIALSPASVSMISDTGVLPASVHLDLRDPSLPRVSVLGTIAATAAVLASTGEAVFLPFTRIDASLVAINPASVTAVLPLDVLNLDSYLELDDPSNARQAVVGSVAVNAAALATFTPPSGEQYNPAFVASGGGVVIGVGGWRAIKVGGAVHVIGHLLFTPAVPGVLETVTMTVPPGMAPTPALFVAASDASGVAGTENGGATVIEATVGAATVDTDITAAAAVDVSVAFQYEST